MKRMVVKSNGHTLLVGNRSPFIARGVVEGFYGTFYTALQRDDLIQFLGQHGFNLYIYAPKNDRHHRAHWHRPYPERVMAEFAQTVAVAEEAGVLFCYAISPADLFHYASQRDFESLTAKLRAFYDLGVRVFGLFLDDIVVDVDPAMNGQRHSSLAEAHADLANRLYAWLQDLDPTCGLLMCPTDYSGTAPFSSYIHTLGATLHPHISIFYTGPDVCSREITKRDVTAFAEAAGRVPIIWDNYPVNDLDMRPEMHLGPLRGRDPELYRTAKGLVANLMVQPEASKIPLLTIAAYLVDPHRYDPEAAWAWALQQVAGVDSYPALRLFAENSLYSCLGTPEAALLERLTGDALDELRSGVAASESEAVYRLEAYLVRLDDACYQLRFYPENLALRQDLSEWLELLDLWQDLARQGLRVLRAREQGEEYERPLRIVREWMEAVQRHPRRVAGRILLPLGEYVLAQTATETAEQLPDAALVVTQ